MKQQGGHPPCFLYVWQGKDLREGKIVCVAGKGVTGGFCACVAGKGLRTPEGRQVWMSQGRDLGAEVRRGRLRVGVRDGLKGNDHG